MTERLTSATHWGAFTARVQDGDIVAVSALRGDTNPAPQLQNLPGAVRHRSRVANPAVRRGWLRSGPGPSSMRGADEFVEVGWDELIERLAAELRRVVDRHGNEAIYGSSYGWASAGRFHHAQSQVHRFLNMLGGYTASRHSYSAGASEVIFPHIFGAGLFDAWADTTTWDVIVDHTDLLVVFGGLPLKNTAVMPGGATCHPDRDYVGQYRARGGRLVSISPLRDDITAIAGPLDDRCRWLAPVPGTDVAIMLALAYVLATESLADRAFLDTYCTGYERFERYLLGDDDGLPKTPEWAAALSGLDVDELRALARRMAAGRTLITTSLSLQRIEHGEQSVWMGATLAAMLGQIGLPGGGYGHGYGSNGVGNPPLACKLPGLPQGANPVRKFIPVAAISELLLRPGGQLAYDGKLLDLPDIKCVYWAGGNPFHHHQNLPRLRRALSRVDTVVVHEQFWTAMAKHADIVVPTTTSFERDDFAGSRTDPVLLAMKTLVPRYANARDDYDTFSALAHRLGFGEQFTEGRSAREWLQHLYEKWSVELDFPVPSFDEFWRAGRLRLPTRTGLTMFADFRSDPVAYPLGTPSGRIEIFSETIDGFGLPDCAGHATWYEPNEWLGGPRARRFPLHLIANQPRTRLHSQLDHGGASMASKILGREPIRMHPDDAGARGLGDGDIVRVFNDRGACLAGVVIDDNLRPRVVQLSTGAWFDPADPTDPDSMCVHGNPNALTNDAGTSSLAHGSTGQHVLVQIEKFTGELPPLRAHERPPLSG
ncbi:molybdopterin guanine dinucleotide-containing S/N-oxide reductase [Mycobacterium lacus]|uniref:Biotin transporter BioY n=1 Tax=Mycobacterium lacus TaxID=169765 RepID=A0A1X1XUW4_9MYCO|nr:molybdopterin guanine dinucleotide-containing S/N-oxide reductase [Mycobacterium lacus]MCV7122189.1 molybdopterin guanine dinucleotide-containing S/N-oxide reductase [Mycobacterium lacus]ORW02643.1 molybdopterin oxidoreductase [Mycobacterium lacus]BBX97024.1 biotin transporter BioY [Mycobacterium lacus]